MSLPPALPAPPSRRRGGAALAVFALIVLAVLSGLGVFAYRYARPRTYLAQAVIQSSVSPEGESRSRGEFGQTQAQVLRRRELLDQVVQQLDLTKVYAGRDARVTSEEARERLYRSLRIEQPEGESRLTCVGVYDSDPLMAAQIANTLVVVYRNDRLGEVQKGIDRSLSQYSAEVQKWRENVVAAHEELQRVRERDQVTDPEPEQVGSAGAGLDTRAYQKAKTKYLQAKQILEKAELALSKARVETNIDIEPMRVVQKAVPPTRPLAWWLGGGRS